MALFRYSAREHVVNAIGVCHQSCACAVRQPPAHPDSWGHVPQWHIFEASVHVCRYCILLRLPQVQCHCTTRILDRPCLGLTCRLPTSCETSSALSNGKVPEARDREVRCAMVLVADIFMKKRDKIAPSYRMTRETSHCICGVSQTCNGLLCPHDSSRLSRSAGLLGVPSANTTSSGRGRPSVISTRGTTSN